MEDKIPEILADLPEDWGYEQIVAPEGESVGLTPQHGYNYLMRKVNECARTLNQIVAEMGQIAPEDMVTAKGGGQLILPSVLGDGPYVITFSEEETTEYATLADLSKYAVLLNPMFTNSIVVGQNAIGALGTGTLSKTSCGSIVAGLHNVVNEGASYLLCVGQRNQCSGGCVTIGYQNEAYNANSIALGFRTRSEGNYSISTGYFTYAKYLEFVHGKFNVVSGVAHMDYGNLFILGNGTSEDARSNAFRVSKDGEIFGGDYHSSGADYAEIYEWLDGNPDAEDRVGRFVCLDGEKIRLAGPEDHILDVLGIVSAAPSIVGDSHDDQWRDMYLRDIFGRLIYEDVEVEDPANPGEMITTHRRKLNPAYDHTQKYIPQSQRPEKSAVGLLGKLVVIDDGTCKANGWACPGPDGIATRSETRTRFRVMSRLDETHIRVNIMVQ